MEGNSTKALLEDLNQAQKKAVTHEEGPQLIVAGAGTGKTTVISRRVAYLIAQKLAKPSEILALTFTEKAASEMEERVDILVPYGATDSWISTFHSFCDRVLRENGLVLGLDTNYRILSQPEQVIFFQENLFEFPLDYYRPLGNPTRHIRALLGVINRAKDEDVGWDEYLDYANKLSEKSANSKDEGLKKQAQRQMEIARTYKKYQQLLKEQDKMDFGDLLFYTLKLFRNHPEVLKEYQQKFKYILVDEFQDTNYAQYQIVKLLGPPGNNITTAGDDDQSIYKFRGASISNILEFTEDYPESELVVLTKNYRSRQSILDKAYRLIQHNNPERLEEKNDIDKKLTGFPAEGEEVVFKRFDTLSSEADFIAEKIRELIEDKGYQYTDFAILLRRNKSADPYLRALNLKKIPWSFSGSQGLYDRPEIKLVTSFLRVISDPEDSRSLHFLASSELYQLDPKVLLSCLNRAHKKNRALYQIFNSGDELEIEPHQEATIQKIVKDVDQYIDKSSQRPTGEVLYEYLMEDTGYLSRLANSQSARDHRKLQNIAKFFEIVENFSEVAPYDLVPEFVRHLDLLIESGDDPSCDQADWDEDVVQVLTVHKAKGLEFKVVFIPELVKLRFPTRSRSRPIELPDELVKERLPEGDFHLQEERRLFYVAMTRACEKLYLTCGKDYGGKRTKKVSRFVMEAIDLPSSALQVQKKLPLEAVKRHAPPPERKLFFDYQMGPDEILNLSHYKIDDYLTCPLKYKFIHILRVPITQHHSVIYGQAIHEAVQLFNLQRKNEKIPPLSDLIEVFEKVWINEGFISREHEDQRFEEGKKALENFYNYELENGNQIVGVEEDFSFMQGNNRVVGRWDRIDRNEEEVILIDYKASSLKDKEKADRRTKDSLQLAIYSLAYQRIKGELPNHLQLRFLTPKVIIGKARINQKMLNKAVEKIEEAAKGIRQGNFPTDPSYRACEYCAYRGICPKTKS